MLTFHSDDLWPTIKSLSTKSKRTRIAVAYFGKDGAGKISFKEGDTLVVAMGLRTVRAGQVNPYEIEKLYKKGVAIYNARNLHAKVFMFDDKAMIASSNISGNSAHNLIETGILSNDRKIVKHANDFIEQLCVEKIEQAYIDLCKKNYHPPSFVQEGDEFVKKGQSKAVLSRLWVISTRVSEASDVIPAKAKVEYINKITNKRLYKLEKITYPLSDTFTKQVAEGDIVIQIHRHEEGSDVYGPARVLGVTLNRMKTYKVLVIEEAKDAIIKDWKKLEKKLEKYGVKSIKEKFTRQIKDSDTKKLLLDFFT